MSERKVLFENDNVVVFEKDGKVSVNIFSADAVEIEKVRSLTVEKNVEEIHVMNFSKSFVARSEELNSYLEINNSIRVLCSRE